MEDKIKIEAYRKSLGKYAKPSVTADIVALRPAYGKLDECQSCENPEFFLDVLFIKRGQWPFEGYWALPGGFVCPDESVEEGAMRELREETSFDAERLIPVGVFSRPGRDMRAWIISNAFVSVHKHGEGQHVKAGDDASDARWLALKSPTFENGRFNLPFFDNENIEFSLTGTYKEDDLGGGIVLTIDDNPLAFDHAEIIVQAFFRMLSFDIKKLVFIFLPKKFTLLNYVNVYQYFTSNSICPSNIPIFCQQLVANKDTLLEVCEDEDETPAECTHALAKLYRRKT